MAKAYADDEEIRGCCRKLMALALLPLDEVETSFYNLRVTCATAVKQALRQLFLYFENQWITDVPVEIWNVHRYHHRTNNNCEGTHVLDLI